MYKGSYVFVLSSRQWKKVPSELIGVWGGNFVAVVSRAPLATGLSASGKVAQTATCRISGDYSGVTGNFYQARVSLGTPQGEGMVISRCFFFMSISSRQAPWHMSSPGSGYNKHSVCVCVCSYSHTNQWVAACLFEFMCGVKIKTLDGYKLICENSLLHVVKLL